MKRVTDKVTNKVIVIFLLFFLLVVSIGLIGTLIFHHNVPKLNDGLLNTFADKEGYVYCGAGDQAYFRFLVLDNNSIEIERINMGTDGDYSVAGKRETLYFEIINDAKVSMGIQNSDPIDYHLEYVSSTGQFAVFSPEGQTSHCSMVLTTKKLFEKSARKFIDGAGDPWYGDMHFIIDYWENLAGGKNTYRGSQPETTVAQVTTETPPLTTTDPVTEDTNKLREFFDRFAEQIESVAYKNISLDTVPKQTVMDSTAAMHSDEPWLDCDAHELYLPRESEFVTPYKNYAFCFDTDIQNFCKMRLGPSKYHFVALDKTVPNNSRVLVKSISINGWTLCEFEGTEGWIRSDFLFSDKQEMVARNKVTSDMGGEWTADDWTYDDDSEEYESEIWLDEENGSGSLLNIRFGPGMEYDVIDQIENGTTVYVYGKIGNWSYVSYDGGTGWCMTSVAHL